MFSFLAEFTRDISSRQTIIVMDEEGMEHPRQYHVLPRDLLLLWAAGTLTVSIMMVALVIFTPLRELIPGYGTGEMKQNARLNSLRLSALEDSLRIQQQYMTRLRHLMLGQVDSTYAGEAITEPDETTLNVSGELAEIIPEPRSQNWTDHEQPALPITRLSRDSETPFREASVETRYLPGLQLPSFPPVEGLITNRFDARLGHYAVDIAVKEGTVIRSIGEGYVIFADWTHEGGYTVTVQHADGYLTIFKHNQRLLKRVGDRVRAREAVAMSGNSGEITTGPHLHFELWHNGLAQDPSFYFIGY